MQNVGFTHISNHFHEFGETSGKLLEILVKPTFSMICLRENVGFTNTSDNFHDYRNYGSASRGFSNFMEMVETGRIHQHCTLPAHVANTHRISTEDVLNYKFR